MTLDTQQLMWSVVFPYDHTSKRELIDIVLILNPDSDSRETRQKLSILIMFFSDSTWRFYVASPSDEIIRVVYTHIYEVDFSTWRRLTGAISTQSRRHASRLMMSRNDVYEYTLMLHEIDAFLHYSLWPTCALSAILPGLIIGLLARWRRARRGDLWIMPQSRPISLRSAPARCGRVFAGFYFVCY